MSTEVQVKHENSIPWRKIPHEIREEAQELADFTEETGREGSITFCQKKDRNRIFVGANYEGSYDTTETLDCNEKFGKSKQIGTMHSHPSNADTIGILPSEPDLTSSIEESYQKGKQIDCITSPDTPLIHCSTFNRPVEKKDVQRYRKARDNSIRGYTDPFFIDNFKKDFDVALFDSKSGEREDQPAPKKVIKAAFGKSNKELRKNLKVFERGAFCDYVADLMGQDRDEVINECRQELRKRSFLGLIDYD